jgi:integrase
MEKKSAEAANLKKIKKSGEWPVIREKVGKTGKVTYQVDTMNKLYRVVDGDWKRYRPMPVCKTLQEAKKKCEEFKVELERQEIERKNLGQVVSGLTGGQREDAARALKVCSTLGLNNLTQGMELLQELHQAGKSMGLGGVGKVVEDQVAAAEVCKEIGVASLREALEWMRPQYAPEQGSVTLNALRDEFITWYRLKYEKATRSKRTFESIQDKAIYFVRETRWGKRMANELPPKEIWAWIEGRAKEKEWEQNTLKRYLDVIGQLFEFGLNKGYLAENPLSSKLITFDKMEALDTAKKGRPVVLEPTQAHNLLKVAYDQNSKRGLLCYVAVCLFTGARPEAEALKMTWEDIDLEDNRVYVRANKSKNTSSTRFVAICPALRQWLELCKPKLETAGDHKLPLAPEAFLYRWKKTRKEAGIPTKVTDLTRHSFASYSYAEHGDKNKLRNDMGHISDAMFAHYVDVTRKIRRGAKEYFGLTPEKVLGDGNNVIPMEAVV